MSHCTHHDTCLTEMLQHAEAVCQTHGVKLTPLRRRVFEKVCAGHTAIKAYELIAQLSTEDHQVKPPTVYRTLDFLLEYGLIHRVDSLNAFVGCSHPLEPHGARLLICTQCGAISELDQPALEHALRDAIQSTGFKPDRTHLEIHGLCAVCQETRPR